MTSTAVATKPALKAAPAPGTPQKQTPKPASVDSPGNWSHPRLAEITKRQKRTAFSDRNAWTIVKNVIFLIVVTIVKSSSTMQKLTHIYPPGTQQYIAWANLGLQVLPSVNIFIALLPLMRKKDDLADIPLTAAQRRLLGLPPSSAPATPGSVFTTPPRVSRTPSLSGSIGSNKSAGGFGASSSSPLSGSPSAAAANRRGAATFSPGAPASPLLQKTLQMQGRRSSLSGGNGTPPGLFNGQSSGASLGESVFAPTPSPSGKRTTVGLNSKWLYEKGRRSSGSAWAS